MKNRKRFFLLFAAVLLYCAWTVFPVYAHALLIRSNPPANANLEKAPPQVELFFSESLEPSLSSISVYDSSGLVMDIGDVRVDPSDPTRMTVSLHFLVDGVYTVAWKAVSAIDGHLTTGSFPFSVGKVDSTALAGKSQKTNAQLPASALVSKWLLLASLALLVGQFSFNSLVWRPTLRTEEGLPSEVHEPSVWEKVRQVALAGLLVGLVLNLLSEAGQVTGSELALPWAPEAGRLILQTRLGAIWLARLSLTMFCVWLAQNYAKRWRQWASFGTALALLLTVSLTSHAATESSPTLPVLSDWIHLIGMSFWLGSLVYLLTGLLQLRKLEDTLQTRLTSLAVEHFSAMALVSVGLIGLTGLYAAYLRVGSIAALYTTLYGGALLIKQGFVALLLALAATNLLLISPLLKQGRVEGTSNVPLVTRFRKIVLSETILAGLLLLSVSLLTYLPPARVPPPVELSKKVNVDDLQVNLDISPGRVGQNTFTVHLTSNGTPVSVVREALLRFTPNRANIAPSEVQLLGQGDGTFTTKGSFLSLPGNWQVQVIVRRENKFDSYANFDFSVQAPDSTDQNAAIPRVDGGLILLNGLLVGWVIASIKKGNTTFRYGLSGILALAWIGAGIFYLTRPLPATNSQENPIPPSAESVAAGKALFEVRCVPCHGTSGKGDGPLGLTLNPHPADLTIHAIPGVHTDAQLFEWISNGFPGSAMPAFKSLLSDTDRWNLVNFIRTLAPK
jgi:copper transport protein